MKIYIDTTDANGWTDGVTHGQLFSKLPGLTTQLGAADVAIIESVCHPKYQFNHTLNRLKHTRKPWVHIDYTEWGWNWDFTKDNVLGRTDCYPCTQFDNHDWGTLKQFIQDYPPILTFQRDLMQRDVGERLIPIDFLAYMDREPVATLEEYSSRPYDVTYVWGYSHPLRPKMHSEIFEAMGTQNVEVLSSFEMLGGHAKSQVVDGHQTWVSIFSPHWVRKPMSEVFAVQRKGRCSICLPGAGFKCFREQEAPNNALMFMLENDLARAYPWRDGENCITIRSDHLFFDVFMATQTIPMNELHELYVEGQATLDRYRAHNYIPNYVIRNIEKRL